MSLISGDRMSEDTGGTFHSSGSDLRPPTYGPIAQMVERTPDKREVPGSSPGRPTSQKSKALIPKTKFFGFWILGLGFMQVGGVAQLGEHLLCTQKVIGSIPFTSTKLRLATASWH